MTFSISRHFFLSFSLCLPLTDGTSIRSTAFLLPLRHPTLCALASARPHECCGAPRGRREPHGVRRAAQIGVGMGRPPRRATSRRRRLLAAARTRSHGGTPRQQRAGHRFRRMKMLTQRSRYINMTLNKKIKIILSSYLSLFLYKICIL